MSQCLAGAILMKKWLKKDEYESWLQKDNKNPNKAFCFACKKSIDLSVMGECNGTINWKKQLKLKASTRVQWESVMAQSTGKSN